MIKRRNLSTMLVLILLFSGINACKKKEGVPLRMATTTSTDNTGLLDYLKPHILGETGIDLQWVAVGTGRALEMAKNCDVDILLVHAPEAEIKFMAGGYGALRREIMYNDFILVGPKHDPAGIRGMAAPDALKIIAAKKVPIASRGDNSGTHKKEQNLWKEAGLEVPDRESWYIQTGQGMINTLTVAAEQDAYAITDRGTFITCESIQKGASPFEVLVEGDKSLVNQYSAISVNPGRCPTVNRKSADKLLAWLSSPGGQGRIGEFRVRDTRLFVPNAR